MNAPFFGCCGWAASSIVPTKRYKTYTAQIFQDFSKLSGFDRVDGESVALLLEDEDWPLTLKHASLVKKTVEYAKFNQDKLPKLGRKLRARAQKGLRTNDTKYTSVAVVLMKKVVRETNTAVQMDYYLDYFLEVVAQLLGSRNNVLHYQGVSLLNLILRQPLFSEDTSGVVHFRKVVEFCDAMKSLVLDYRLAKHLCGGAQKSEDSSLLVISSCYACLGLLLKLASKFKLNLPQEDDLLDFCVEVVATQAGDVDFDGGLATALRAFEVRHSMPKSLEALSSSLLGMYSHAGTARRISGCLLDKLSARSELSSRESVEAILLPLGDRVAVSGGSATLFYASLLEACRGLYRKDLVQASNLVLFVLQGVAEDRLACKDIGGRARALEQWLSLRAVPSADEGEEGLRRGALEELEGHMRDLPGGKLDLVRVLENWSNREEVQGRPLDVIIRDLGERGVVLKFKPCTLGVTLVALKDIPAQQTDPHVCPYENQVMLEEALLALGSGVI